MPNINNNQSDWLFVVYVGFLLLLGCTVVDVYDAQTENLESRVSPCSHVLSLVFCKIF